MLYQVVEIFPDESERVTDFKDFYKARDYAQSRVTAIVADITDFDGNVLESWSNGTLAGDLYSPLAKTKYYVVRHSYYSNYRCHDCVLYTTDKAKAEEHYKWANDIPGFCDVYMQEEELSNEYILVQYYRLDELEIRANKFNPKYFITTD